MDTLIANATSSFMTTTGFDVSALVVWAGDNLFKVFIGSGLALLYELRYWIVAVVIIAGVVYFVYRLWHFFRH